MVEVSVSLELFYRRNKRLGTREIQHKIHDIYGFAISYGNVSKDFKKTIDAIDDTSKEILSMCSKAGS